MRTIVYIDGFNLYFRLLRKKPQFKWLDLKALSQSLLSDENDIVAIKYYTAHVTGRLSPDAPRKQQIYLNALATVPEVSVHLGSFQVKDKWAGIVQPPKFKPEVEMHEPWPDVVKVVNTEEKGSDVNLASHLLFDACQDSYDVGVVLSNDSDLKEPIKLASKKLKKTIGLFCPTSKPTALLKSEVSFIRHIRDRHLRESQFDDELSYKGEAIINPWRVLE